MACGFYGMHWSTKMLLKTFNTLHKTCQDTNIE